MDWFQYIDAYCERMDPGFWAEPLNATTNGLYLLAAILMFIRVRRDDLRLAETLCVVLGLISIGSFLFHTLATAWASAADSLPILVFILVYLFGVNRDFARWPLWAALLGTAGFIPFATGVTILAGQLPFFAISSFYWSVPILLFAYAYVLRRAHRETARGMVIGGLLLCVSITIRSVDMPLCDQWPIGTHFLWHVINAIMLAWMIEVYRRHVLARLRDSARLNP